MADPAILALPLVQVQDLQEALLQPVAAEVAAVTLEQAAAFNTEQQ